MDFFNINIIFLVGILAGVALVIVNVLAWLLSPFKITKHLSYYSETLIEPLIIALVPIFLTYVGLEENLSDLESTKDLNTHKEYWWIYGLTLFLGGCLFLKDRRSALEKYKKQATVDAQLKAENINLEETNQLLISKMSEIDSSVRSLNKEVKDNSDIRESIDQILTAKIDRFNEKLADINTAKTKPTKEEIFNEITQPEKQLETILKSFAPQIKSVVGSKGKCRLMLARLCHDEDVFKQVTAYPVDESLQKTIGSYPKDKGIFSRCRSKSSLEIINDISKEIRMHEKQPTEGQTYIKTNNNLYSHLNSGSILAVRIDSRSENSHGDLYFSIHCREINLFDKSNIDHNFLYESVLKPIMDRILIEYKLLKLKNIN